MNKIEKILKNVLKKKMKINTATIVMFMIFGKIVVAAEPNIIVTIDKTGIQIGTNSQAKGEGSIATGNNSIAIGTNAVATGGNETADTIKNKLNQNSYSVGEISKTKDEITKLTQNIQDLKLKEKDVIGAGAKVEEIRKMKDKLALEITEAQKNYNDYSSSIAEKMNEYNAKIEDLNSRLIALGTIQNVDITSEEGLNRAATELKAKVEKDSTLNLSQDFYKEYTKNYYKALGDLREAEITKGKFDRNNYRYSYDGVIYIQNEEKYGYSNLSGVEYNGGLYFFASDYGATGELKYDLSFASGYGNYKYIMIDNNVVQNMNFSNPPTPNIKIRIPNVKTDIVTLDEYNFLKAETPKYLKTIEEYFELCNDKFLTKEMKEKLNKAVALRFEILNKSYEVAYYQGEYEKTKDTTWLDKKQKALVEYENLKKSFGEDSIAKLREAEFNKFVKENITDVKEKNKITVDKLTSDLELALGVNKDEIQNIESEKNKLNNIITSLENQYNGLNPTEKDMILSKEYENVMNAIDSETKKLQLAQAKLQELENNLTLNDLTDVGENSIAIGTDTISSGTNAIAFGKGNIATKENSVAIGTDNLVNATNSVALGNSNLVSGDKLLAIGTENILKGTASGVIGDPNLVYANNSYIVGNNNIIGDKNNILDDIYVFGSNNMTASSDNKTTAIGSNNILSGKNLSVFGNGNQNYFSNNGIILGSNNKGSFPDTIIIGNNNDFTGGKTLTNVGVNTNSIILGNNITGNSSGNNIIALGNNINLSSVEIKSFEDAKIHSITLGNESKAEKNALSIGNKDNLKKIVYVDKGEISETSTDSINGSQLFTVKNEIISNFNNYYTKTEIDNSLKDYSKKTETYTKTEIDELIKNSSNSNNSTVDLSNISKEVIEKIDSKVDKTEFEKMKIGEGSVTSQDLTIENGENRLVGTEELKLSIKDGVIKESHLSKEVTDKIDSKVSKTEIDSYVKDRVEKVNEEIYSTIDNKINSTNQRIDLVEKEVKNLGKKVRQVTALSTALASVEYPEMSVGDIGVGAGISSFEGEQGIAVGVAYIPTENTKIGVKYAGLASNRFRGAISGSFGYKFNFKNIFK